MDESAGLENRYGGNLIVGSNPTLSATVSHKKARRLKSADLSFLSKLPNVDLRF